MRRLIHSPYFLLTVWSALLLLTSQSHPSLMAHDEGNFAVEARFMVESGHWLARQWWGNPVYTHGIALNWLMASSYSLFGRSEVAVRLPSLLACLVSVVLIYSIGRRLLTRSQALVAALLLPVMPLYLQYGHLATQDMLLVCLELTGIWALLQAEQSRERIYWGLLAGSIVGIGFLVKSFMIALPAIALLPYLVGQNGRHRHLANPGIYVGLIGGILVVFTWLHLSVLTYGAGVLNQLFGKLSELSEPFHPDAGPLYYFWNIPVNAFPWGLFALVGLGLALRHYRTSPYRLLLIGYPVVLLALLCLFPTRTPYYALQLYPFMALFSGLALDHLIQKLNHWFPRFLSYSFGLLGGLLLLAGIIAITKPDLLPADVAAYGLTALGLGLGLSLLPMTWHTQQKRSPQIWLANWLGAFWLGFAIAGLTGVWGNYSPTLKAALQSPPLASVLAAHAVDFVVAAPVDGETNKTWVLLTFYTPHLGQLYPHLSNLPPDAYAWVSPGAELATGVIYQELGQIQQWRLIHKQAA
ncbi:glycosyltransferase family 39 protein [Sphaerothrix gracilis]|uniref:ArnT family glycosyltransferase n=1 Tax=Sphaerothrix gracilis TaxID=3151835 RepID=UPI0031FDA154